MQAMSRARSNEQFAPRGLFEPPISGISSQRSDNHRDDQPLTGWQTPVKPSRLDQVAACYISMPRLFRSKQIARYSVPA